MDIFGLVPSKIMTTIMSNFTLVLTLPMNPLQLVFDFTRVMFLDRRSLRNRRIQFTTKVLKNFRVSSNVSLNSLFNRTSVSLVIYENSGYLFSDWLSQNCFQM